MAETRKLAAIMAVDVVGFSRLIGANEDRTLARLRALRSDLIDPTIAVHNGRVATASSSSFAASSTRSDARSKCKTAWPSGRRDDLQGFEPRLIEVARESGKDFRRRRDRIAWAASPRADFR